MTILVITGDRNTDHPVVAPTTLFSSIPFAYWKRIRNFADE